MVLSILLKRFNLGDIHWVKMLIRYSCCSQVSGPDADGCGGISVFLLLSPAPNAIWAAQNHRCINRLPAAGGLCPLGVRAKRNRFVGLMEQLTCGPHCCPEDDALTCQGLGSDIDLKTWFRRYIKLGRSDPRLLQNCVIPNAPMGIIFTTLAASSILHSCCAVDRYALYSTHLQVLYPDPFGY